MPEQPLFATISDRINSRKWPDGRSSTELLLVLACARASICAASAADIRQAVAQRVDFLKAISLASCHGLAPCLIQQLQQHAATALPESVVVEFQRWLRAHILRRMELITQLFQVLDRLKEQGIPALAFKGPVLAQQLYGDLSLREFIDLDILVFPTDAWTVIASLSTKGFEPQFVLTRSQFARFHRSSFHMGLYRAAKGVTVEVHWALLSPGYRFSPAVQVAWQALQSVSIAGRSIKTFSSETQLLFSCLHQAKHNWSRLGWFMDLAALIRQSPAMDWQQIQNYAGSFGTARMIRVSLRLVQQLFEVTLPASINDWVEHDVCSRKIAERILNRLLLEDTTAGQSMPLDPLFRASMESLADRAFYWFDTIFRPTPLEWALLALPDSLYPLYYPIRAGRLFCKHTVGRLIPRRTPRVAIS